MSVAAATIAAASLAGCDRGGDVAVFTGYAEAELVYVAAPSAGTLRALAAVRGGTVARGEPLFALDAEPEALAHDAAQARSEAASAQAADLTRGGRPAELAAVDAQIAQARAALAASTAALDRNRRLVNQGYVSATRLDDLVAARGRDAARVAELQSLRAVAAQAARDDAVAAAAAVARASAAELALARRREQEKSVASPVAAQVYDTIYRVGEWVPAGSPVVVLLPPGAVKVRFFVPEPLLAQARVGSDVAVGCSGCPAGLAARVVHVSPQPEFTPPVIYGAATRSKLVFAVEALPVASSASAALHPGQPVDVRPAPSPP